MSIEITEELCLMALKIDTKFEGKGLVVPEMT